MSNRVGFFFSSLAFLVFNSLSPPSPRHCCSIARNPRRHRRAKYATAARLRNLAREIRRRHTPLRPDPSTIRRLESIARASRVQLNGRPVKYLRAPIRFSYNHPFVGLRPFFRPKFRRRSFRYSRPELPPRHPRVCVSASPDHSVPEIHRPAF